MPPEGKIISVGSRYSPNFNWEKIQFIWVESYPYITEISLPADQDIGQVRNKVRALRSITEFWYAWPVSSTVYNQKSQFVLVASGTTTIWPFEYRSFSEVCQCILESWETFLNRNYFYSNINVNTNKIKKTGTNFDMTTESLVEKY